MTDEEWELIEPLLPPPVPTGRPRADDRKTLNGIFMSSQQDVNGWIYPENMDLMSPHGEGSEDGRKRVCGI